MHTSLTYSNILGKIQYRKVENTEQRTITTQLFKTELNVNCQIPICKRKKHALTTLLLQQFLQTQI